MHQRYTTCLLARGHLLVEQLIITDPSGTFIMHTCPLFPLISTCISVPFGFHWAVVYCYNVRWCVGVPVLCVLAFVPLWIVQMITGLIPCVNHCARVLFIRGTPRSFVLGFYPVFCYVFVWTSPRAFSGA